MKGAIKGLRPTALPFCLVDSITGCGPSSSSQGLCVSRRNDNHSDRGGEQVGRHGKVRPRRMAAAEPGLWREHWALGRCKMHLRLRERRTSGLAQTDILDKAQGSDCETLREHEYDAE